LGLDEFERKESLIVLLLLLKMNIFYQGLKCQRYFHRDNYFDFDEQSSEGT
jgi:hypothetical protein